MVIVSEKKNKTKGKGQGQIDYGKIYKVWRHHSLTVKENVQYPQVL